jgi:[acyl-carrier-protein] S-malonyltransferase
MSGETIALLFPGQGSQAPGMGRAFAQAAPAAREIFDRADAVLGRSISKLCFEGAEEELRRTANTQPALYVACAAALAHLRAQGIDGAIVGGHSLGEYTALLAAGAMDFETGLKLVELRGRAMEEAGRNRHGTMAAVLNLDDDKVGKVCEEASSSGVVVPANFNSPGQVVISGEEPAIERAIELAKEAGARRAMKLNVGGAFHSPLMAEAAERLRAVLARAAIDAPRLRFVANVSAGFVDDPEVIRRSLADQLLNPVRWTDSIRTMVEAGARRFIEVGPGSVLTGLLKRIDKSASALAYNHPDVAGQLGDLLSAKG